MKVFSEERVPIKSWCNSPEDGAVAQARNLANLPFVYKHVALMPDTHQGYGMPIGGVIATQGVVIPNAVGVDIGCGMCALKTNLKDISKEEVKKVLGKIRELVPVGFAHHTDAHKQWMPLHINSKDMDLELPVVNKQFQSACHQVGTLGGGNHFIELQKGDDGFIWAMIHSGSRNLGYKVAQYYNNLAKTLNAQWYSEVTLKMDLAFLPLDTEEGQAYLREMNYCLAFAKANRDAMMSRVREALQEYNDCTITQEINIHHNYANMENHFGKNVMIHRKGATSAREGELGIIPGSQGTSSYIVRGLGNPESFNSCSHGAGRKMGRKQAQRTLNLEEEIKRLEDKGIVHSIRTAKDLDEASGSYKDIDVVMEEQKELVEVVVKLTPLGVVKG